MRALWTLVLVPLSACGGADVDGTWVGDCVLSSSFTEDYALGLEMDLVRDEDSIGGSALLTDELAGELEGVVSGTVDGRDVALDIAYDLGLGSGTTMPEEFDDLFDIRYTVDATVKGDQMEGRCAMKVMGIGLGADIVLERI